MKHDMVISCPLNWSPDVTSASAKIAQHLAKKYGVPFICPRDPKPEITEVDLTVMVAGGSSFCEESFRDRLARLWVDSRVVVTAVNDFMLAGRGASLPKVSRASKVYPRPYVRWTTMPSHMVDHDSFVNWNQIAWDPLPEKRPPTEKGLLYYGAFRAERRDYFAEYFGAGVPYPATISTGLRRGRWSSIEDFQRVAAGARFIPKFAGAGLVASLSAWPLSIYLEDITQHTLYGCPAMRFYELLSAGVGIAVDHRAAGNLVKAGYAVGRYIVSKPADVAKLLKRSTAIADEQRTWQADYAKNLDREINAAYKRTKTVVKEAPSRRRVSEKDLARAIAPRPTKEKR